MNRSAMSELMAADWATALAGQEEQLASMGEFLRAELAAGRSYLPAGNQILRAFSLPLADVRVLILGQDPYPTPSHPIGLCFAVDKAVRPLPKSLANIYTELETDLGIPRAHHGDLTAWFDQGVLLLNRTLTVRPGAAGSHRGQGWEQFTQAAIEALVHRAGPLTAILWGRDAQSISSLLMQADIPFVASPHPSPLSAYSGFFGSRPFSRTNDNLRLLGSDPINWQLPA